MTAGQDLDSEFLTAADPYRRELLAHCYRMMGSIHDAEDLLQETLLRGWRGYDSFDGRSSIRTWLHRIATNACLTALEGRGRRPLPTGLGASSSDPSDDLVERGEIPWLEPIPDSMVWGESGRADDPAAIVAGRESVRLAFIAALQHLSARQRAVLVLREVLQWKAAEVADALGTSTAAVNSLLQRARAQLSEAMPDPDVLVEPESEDTRELLRRYVDGFEKYDIDGLVEMFTRDAVWEMPPFVGWYVGGSDIARLIKEKCPAQGAGDMRLLPTSANAQPALGLYMRGADGIHRPFQLHVLDVTDRGVAHVTCFFDTGLFKTFGLPPHP
ncbi:sigma-70 family RNA polymerase sigma factor [Rhodococcus sp. ABRD24]|uniref:sigma-70 family RNA polymerase sigma factor n=1 Tax=Rhodococcus sp. ABRD24 TaxID=2507582 RepID=UPI00103B0EF8|nr:sigma-70 family RNA polymerase sigma factor [Rhodococcus sp. ABRD24]QBJ96145.1 sigma-70 family RNA polymerase sigma factor [Rhodococcus sp. ABRD24]